MKAITEHTSDCVAVALYGVAADPRTLKSLYLQMLDWFNSSIGSPPDKLGIRGPGFSGKIIQFSRSNTKLQKNDFTQITDINLFSTLATGRSPLVNWRAAVVLSLSYKPSIVLAANCSVATLENRNFLTLIESCISALKPAYGIGYYLDRKKGPIYYALGINMITNEDLGRIYTNEEEEGLHAIQGWGQYAMARNIFREGLLRDVYPCNYLTEPHLDRQVGKITLRNWIASDLSRGSLTKLDDRMVLWKVEAEQIKPVREELWKAGVLFDWRKYL